MHPLLLPWEFSVGTLSVLAYVTAVVIAAVAAWVVYTRGDDSQMGTYGWPLVTLVGGSALLCWLVAKELIPELKPQPLPLHTYGLMIAVGFVSGLHLAGREAERSGFLKKDQIYDVAFYILLAAMVGSRVLFIIVNWTGPDGYGAHPDRILKFWTGGLVFFGGLIGATLMSVWYARKHKLDFKVLADIVIPVVALGHFFGRMGCIAAGCCWGKVCADPGFVLGAKYPPGALAYSDMIKQEAHRAFIVEHGHTPAVHPTQLYEGVGELLIFFLLTWYRPKKRFHGQILAMYMICYSLLRLTIETFRGDWGRGMLFKFPAENPVILSTSQLIGVAILIGGVVLFLRWRPKELPGVDGEGPAEPAAAAA